MPLSSEQAKFLARVGAAIKAERERVKLTQQRLAELADLDVRTVQKIEAGELNVLITTIQRLKSALDCSWERLLSR